MKEEGDGEMGRWGNGEFRAGAKRPHPDHDHEYMVPDMVPALSRRERGVFGQLDAKTVYTISIFGNFLRWQEIGEFPGKSGLDRAAGEGNRRKSATLNCTKGPAETYLLAWIVTTNNV